MEGTVFAGWILASVAAAGLYGAIKNKPWLSVLLDAVNPGSSAKSGQVKPSFYTTVEDATYIPSSPSGNVGGGTAPASSGAGAVLSYAEAQLGKPYKWATAGPNTFDCSGLTMRAFDTVGIALPHNSAMQLAQTRIYEIAQTDNPPPGALVFYGTPPHHVGISIGNGQMISAPHTGDVVKVSSVAGFGSDYSAVTNPLAKLSAKAGTGTVWT